MENSTFIGLDVHKATISVAIACGVRGGDVRHWGNIPHRPDHVRKLVEKLIADGRRLHFCYEAGPCGYGLHRQLVELGHDCLVVAPSLIPVGAVVKPRRNAPLAREVQFVRQRGLDGSFADSPFRDCLGSEQEQCEIVR